MRNGVFGNGHEISLLDNSFPPLVGLGIGLVGSVLVSRTMQSTLYGVGAIDFSVTMSVAAILFATALFASTCRGAGPHRPIL